MSGRWPALLLTAVLLTAVLAGAAQAAALSGAAQAAALVTEVIPAGFSSAEELAEILHPVVPPPGSDEQTLRVLEGKEAFIHAGESVPISTVDGHGTHVDSASASSKITRTRRGDAIYVRVQRLD